MRSETRASQKRTCLMGLQMLNGAAEHWAIVNGKGVGAEYTLAEITPYLKSSVTCPNGGVLTYGKLDSPIACSIHGQIP